MEAIHMGEKSIKEILTGAGVKQALGYLDSNPEKNLPKLISWVDAFDRHDAIKKQLDVVRKVVSDPTNNWYQLVTSLWTDIDPGVRKTLFENLILNASVIGGSRRKKAEEQNNCNIPWAILMDPTSACNLRCTGCWAAEYGDRMNMDFDTLDSIIKQGKSFGTYFYIYSGGEPLVRKNDIIKLCEKHSDCMFLAFTNGTLIDGKFADEMLRVRNFVPAISVEGFEEETDSRRGAGTYGKVIRAMEILKEKKLLFGISCCYTSQNTDVIGSEEYFDAMIAQGGQVRVVLHLHAHWNGCGAGVAGHRGPA